MCGGITKLVRQRDYRPTHLLHLQMLRLRLRLFPLLSMLTFSYVPPSLQSLVTFSFVVIEFYEVDNSI